MNGVYLFDISVVAGTADNDLLGKIVTVEIPYLFTLFQPERLDVSGNYSVAENTLDSVVLFGVDLTVSIIEERLVGS